MEERRGIFPNDKIRALLRHLRTKGSVSMVKHICNMCGKDFDDWDEQESFHMDYHVGYGSKYDGSVIKADFCCDCFDRIMDVLVEKCKYSPIQESGVYF